MIWLCRFCKISFEVWAVGRVKNNLPGIGEVVKTKERTDYGILLLFAQSAPTTTAISYWAFGS